MEQKDFSDPTLSQIISALKKVQGELKDPKTAAPERKPEAKDIVSRVSQWLETESGYPLEMVTVAALASAGFDVVQSDYFEDHDGEREILRELDVTGYVNHSESGIGISVAILVECKSSVGKPWLLFTYPHGYSETLQVTRRCATNEVGRRLLDKLQFDTAVQEMALFPFLPHCGYALTLGMRKPGDKDTAYEALMGVCTASLSHIGRLYKHGLIAFDWPTVVIKAPLLACHLDDNEKIVVNSIDKGTLIWRNPILNAHTIVDIYTEQAFKARAAELHKSSVDFAAFAWRTAMESQKSGSP